MGLITKIEDKLSGNKSSSQTEPTTSSSKYDQGSNTTSDTTGGSSLRNPISSSQTSGPTGTHVSSSRGDDYGTSDNPNVPYNQSAYAQQGSHPTSHTTQTSSGLTGSSHQPSATTTTNTTTSSTGNRQYYDPYSSKGQRTAASAAQTHGMTPSSHHQSSIPYEDTNVSRSQQGGVLNQTEQQRYPQQSSSHMPHSATHDSSMASGGYPTSSSQHHYGRDAGMVGGAGAAGVGAYEMGKHSGSSSDPYSSQHQSSAQQPSTMSSSAAPVSNYSHVNPSGGQQQSSPGLTSSNATAGEESGGLAHSKKMAAAYEAGYKDGMEHAKADMQSKFPQLQL